MSNLSSNTNYAKDSDVSHLVSGLMRPILDTQITMPLILHGEDMAMSNNTSDNSDDDSQQFDFQQHFIQHEEATLCTFARDDSLQNRGVCSGDLLIVNRKLRPQHNDIVLAALYGDLTCKILDLTNNTIHSGSDDETPTPIADLDELHIIGVVTHSSTKHRG